MTSPRHVAITVRVEGAQAMKPPHTGMLQYLVQHLNEWVLPCAVNRCRFGSLEPKIVLRKYLAKETLIRRHLSHEYSYCVFNDSEPCGIIAIGTIC